MGSGRRPLTDITIRKASVPSRGQVEMWDAQIPGFGLRISAKGRKSFVLLYRHQGRPRRLTLGAYPGVTLAAARARAHVALGQVAEGADPAREKLIERRRPDAEGFDALIDEFIDKYAQPRNRDWRETQRVLRRDFLARWGSRAVSSIQKSEVTEVIDRIVKRGSPGSAARSFSIVRRFFNWCVERGVLAISPCYGLRAPTAPAERDRVLTDSELRAVWRAATQIGYPYGPVVQLLTVTAQRKSEVIGLQWAELGGDDALWSLARERTKSKRQHVVPLSKVATGILAALPCVDDKLLFPSVAGSGVISGFSKWKARLDELCGVADWRLHDLRRTAATGMAKLGVAPHIIERILNHSTGTLGGVAGIYNRFGYLPEMRAALQLWGEHVERLVSPTEPSERVATCRASSPPVAASRDQSRRVDLLSR